MIYGIRTSTSGQLLTRTIIPMKSPPTAIIARTFYPGKLPLNNPPEQLTPRQLPPMKYPPDFCS